MSTPSFPAADFSTRCAGGPMCREICAAAELAERSRYPESRNCTGRSGLSDLRRMKRPRLLGQRRVAHRYCPGDRRVHDQGALARDHPFVFRRIIPGEHAQRQKRHDFLEPRQNLFHLIRIDRDLPSPSTRCAPCAANTALTQLTKSLQVLSGMRTVPCLAHFSAAARNPSHVQASARTSSGGEPAGYIWVSRARQLLEVVDAAHGVCPVV